ncbi:hypothetical protein H0H93_011490 [Arthromyces matolae]|nr:hypothetical protein H0H93_011490 [Arthromyces matolae]
MEGTSASATVGISDEHAMVSCCREQYLLSQLIVSQDISPHTDTETDTDKTSTSNMDTNTSTSNMDTNTSTSNTDTNTSTSNTDTNTSTSNTDTNTSTSNTDTNTSTSNTDTNTSTSNTDTNTSTSNTDTNTSPSNTDTDTSTNRATIKTYAKRMAVTQHMDTHMDTDTLNMGPTDPQIVSPAVTPHTDTNTDSMAVTQHMDTHMDTDTLSMGPTDPQIVSPAVRPDTDTDMDTDMDNNTLNMGPIDPETEYPMRTWTLDGQMYRPFIDLTPVPLGITPFDERALWSHAYPEDFMELALPSIIPPTPTSSTSHHPNVGSSLLLAGEYKEDHEEREVVHSRSTAPHLRFLDLEAEDADEDDEEDEEEDEELATFLDNDGLAVPSEDAERALAVALNAETSSDQIDQWHSLLNRARGRANSSLSLKEKYEHESSLHLTAGSLWRVSVQVGTETSVAFALMNKCLATDSSHGIRSVIGNRSRPGWVYVEAPLQSDVRRFCQGVSHIHRFQDFAVVPPEDTVACLKGAPPFIPPSNSWVRLTRPPLYKNDLAYVLKYQDRHGAKVFVVPRVSLDSPGRGRPPQALLNLEEVQKSFPDKVRVLREDPPKFEFKRHLYLEGYRCLKTFDFVSTVPTQTELNWFINSTYVTKESVAAVQLQIADSQLQIKDRILVVHGELKGLVGVIFDLDEHSASVMTTDYPVKQIDVRRADVRKNFFVGDQVTVLEGPRKGTVGWVVGISSTHLTVYSHKSDEQFEIGPTNASFYVVPQVYVNKPAPETSFRLPSGASHDPLHHLKDQEVRVTGANPFKGYEARVKDTRNDGKIVVELQAGLRNVVVDPKNLADRALQPLPTPSGQHIPTLATSKMPLTSSVPLPSTLAPASSYQYTGMTPRPTTSATPLSPAWDPSSSTPGHVEERTDLAQFFNPFLFSERFKAKTPGVGVYVTVTHADGTTEMGVWTSGSLEDGAPLVKIGLKTSKVAEESITPMRPRGPGDRVVVVNHNDDKFGEILWIVDPGAEGAETCIVRGGPPRRTKFDKDFNFSPYKMISHLSPARRRLETNFHVLGLFTLGADDSGHAVLPHDLVAALKLGSNEGSDSPRAFRPTKFDLAASCSIGEGSTRLRISKKNLTKERPPTPSYTPVRGPSSHQIAAGKGKLPSLVFIPLGQTLAQRSYLPDRPRTTLPVPPDNDDNPLLDHEINCETETNPIPLSKHRQKRERQWANWHNCIPTLIACYLNLLHRTKSLREPPFPVEDDCLCDGPKRPLKVVVVRFEFLEEIVVQICECSPAAYQLIKRGCFPSAPREPTLAVDFKVLDFVSTLFIHIAPNNTAWCKTIETFLSKQGYKLTTEGSMRKRFGNALIWYNVLQDEATAFVEKILSKTRRAITDLNDGLPLDQGSDDWVPSPVDLETPDYATPTNSPPPRTGSKRPLEDDAESGEDDLLNNPFKDALPRDRPSDYLRACCPLCFGGEFPQTEKHKNDPDAIVCVDACFTQKRNRQIRDPPRKHPRSAFVPEETILAMEKYMESLRPSKARGQKRQNVGESEEEDFYEGDGKLRVPKSVLDACESGFTAADDRREKASTQFFDDTALMALLCRHDIVLFIANMSSAGEKQHYVANWNAAASNGASSIAIPTGFHSEYLYFTRLVINGHARLSIIHASAQALYHQRLYILDHQVEHARMESIENLSTWIIWRSLHAKSKRSAAEEILQNCGKSETYLRRQWKLQVQAQTRPLPRQSRVAGRNAVDEVLRLEDVLDDLKVRVSECDSVLEDPSTAADEFADVRQESASTRNRIKTLKENIRQKRRRLGINDLERLNELRNNPYIAKRVNALALKNRLKERLRARKFELDRLERAYRYQANESSVKRREPSIRNIARQYNAACDEIKRLIARGKGLPGALPPQKIEMEGLFTLDVDDAIWQNIGLDEESGREPPAWLAEERVRDGIKALLEHDRCVEEEARLRHECRSLRFWMDEEWKIITAALKDYHDDPGIAYQLSIRHDHLIKLCWLWEGSSTLISGDIPSLSGPSKEDLVKYAKMQRTASFKDAPMTIVGGGDGEASDRESEYSDSEIEDADMALLDILDAVELVDNLRDDANPLGRLL